MQITIFFDNLLKNDHLTDWFELIGTCYGHVHLIVAKCGHEENP